MLAYWEYIPGVSTAGVPRLFIHTNPRGLAYSSRSLRQYAGMMVIPGFGVYCIVFCPRLVALDYTVEMTYHNIYNTLQY